MKTNKTMCMKDAFKECPQCNSQDFLELGPNLSCLNCDWNSCAAYVEAGGMDNLFRAYIEHFHEETPQKLRAA